MIDKALEPHMWDLILPYLSKPKPRSLSKPPRSALRNNDLVNASLVSHLLNDIAHPLLYSHIVTDQLYKVFVDLDPNRPSTYRRFACTRSMSIEYSEKCKETVCSYSELLRHGGREWDGYGLSETDRKERAYKECEQEVRDLRRCLRAVNRVGMKRALPKLSTIAIASIYSSDAEYWGGFDAWSFKPDWMNLLGACIDQFEPFLSSGNLTHLCIRNTSGPLSLPGLSFASTYPKVTYNTTVHFTSQTTTLPLPLGNHITWSIDASEDWANSIFWMEGHTRKLATIRKAQQHSGLASDIADVQIYCSSAKYGHTSFNPTVNNFGILPHNPFSTTPPRDLSLPTQKTMAYRLGRLVQELFRRDSGLKDRVSWRISADSPACPSCGTCPPE